MAENENLLKITPTTENVPVLGKLELASIKVGAYMMPSCKRLKVDNIYIDDGILWVDVSDPDGE